MKNILLTIAYDGTGFHGWQRQPRAATIQGHLEAVMSRSFRTEIHLNGASRTDAGVHAFDQKANFLTNINIPAGRIAKVVNDALLGAQDGSFAKSPIRIIDAREVPLDFHARFSCVGKKYIYRIKNTGEVDVFDRNYVYYVAGRLDVTAMHRAAKLLVGTRDFKSFEASGGSPRRNSVRTITEMGLDRRDESGILEISVSGDGFLYNMVRIICGTLVEIGQGRRDADEMRDILEAKDRSRAGHTAPPMGLYLAEVRY